MTSALREQLVSALAAHLEPHFRQFHDYRFDDLGQSIEVRAQVTDQATSRTLILRIIVPAEYAQVEIPNIFVPEALRRQGLGKSLIRLVQQIANQHSRRTFVTDLTPSFFARLEKRGARVVVEGDVVEICDDTRLT